MTPIRARLLSRLRLAPHTRAGGRERRWLALPRLVVGAHREALWGLGGALCRLWERTARRRAGRRA